MYTIILRKGKIELEFTTDDKEVVRKHLWLIINQASNVAANTNVLPPTPQEQPVEEPKPIETPQPAAEEIPAQPVIEEEKPIQVQEEQVEVKPAVFEHIQESEKTSVVTNEEIIPQTIDITPVKPITINSLQNPEPEQPSEPDFDKILNKEIEHTDQAPPILKDPKFIEYVEGKAAIEKIDFLVITAQYLAQYENMNTFNLKHINAKLMQNFTLIVDHSVLQSAIAREYITRIHEGTDDTSSEYMLTEKGLRSY